MIIDANSGAVLHNSAGDELRHPASLTKMMTLYMTFELIEMGRLSYSSKIKVTQEAAGAAPSKLELEPGEEITVIDAIKALVTKSANDMAVALAQHIGGTESNFARLMTEKAHQLGMTKTVFRNASGLPDPQQVTTARDMITLGLHLQDDFPKHYPLFGLRTFTYNGHSHRNHNTLLLSYRGTDGIKTGYTHASGFNLVASVHRDGKHLVGAIFGGELAGSRNAQLRSLLDRSFGHASSVKTRKAAPQLIASARPAARTKPVSVAKAEPAPSPRAPVQVAAAAPKPQPKPLTSKTVEPAPSAAKVADASPSIPKIIEPVPKTIEEAAALKTIDDEGQTPAAPIAASGPVVVAQVDLPRTTDVTAVAEAPTIDIAKVRRVMVAPRVKSAVPTPEPVEERSTDVAPAPAQPAFVTASAGSAPKVDFRSDRQGAAVAPVAAPSPQAQPLADETVIAKAATAAAPAAARQPSTFEAQMAALAVKLNFPTPPNSGTPQQVAEAAGAPPPPAYRLKGPDPITEVAAAPVTAPAGPVASAPLAAASIAAAPVAAAKALAPAARVAVAKGAFQIQIGAFGSPVEATNQISVVRQNAAQLLNGHEGVTLPIVKGDRKLFRAKFAGFDSTGAANTCLELRRRQIDCFVMKAE